MKLPSIVAGLFEIADRRQTRLAEARDTVDALHAEYRQLLAEGRDADAEKVAAKIMRAESDARTAEMALKVGAELEQEQRQAAAAEARRTRVREFETARAVAQREAIRLEELVQGELLAQWRRVDEAHREARDKARAAGIRLDRGESGLERIDILWNRTWILFQQSVAAAGTWWPMPAGRSPSRPLPSVAETYANNRVPADPAHQE